MKLLAAFVTLILLTSTAHAQSEVVTFEVTEFSGKTVTLRAKLNKPKGDGPFPALVLLHGCHGLGVDVNWDDDNPFLEHGYDGRQFLDWGYVTLWIDSFGPRGQENVCDGSNWPVSSPAVRARDAHAGKDFLAGLPFVDGGNIAVVGFSHGGNTVLKAISNDAMHQPLRDDPFKAAVAYYPLCDLVLRRPDAPLLVLIGDADDWTRAARCEAMTVKGDTDHSYDLVIYPGATHAFDWVRAPAEYMGHRIVYDPVATADALRRIKALLAEHMTSP